jgi:DNA-directed RNA polymerase specialized sigma24 family protein
MKFMREFEDSSFEEIGKAIGCTPGRTFQIYRRAIYKIRKNNPEALKRVRDLLTERQRIREGKSNG